MAQLAELVTALDPKGLEARSIRSAIRALKHATEDLPTPEPIPTRRPSPADKIRAVLVPGVPVHLKAKRLDVRQGHFEPVGLLIRQRREQLGLTQEAVAKLLGTQQCSLSRWETGPRQPKVSFYPAIIAFLGREPWSDLRTPGELARAYRYRHGLSIERAAAKMGLRKTTLCLAELQEATHNHVRQKLLTFLRAANQAALA